MIQSQNGGFTEEWTEMLEHRRLVPDQNMTFLLTFRFVVISSKCFNKSVNKVVTFLSIQKGVEDQSFPVVNTRYNLLS